MDQPTHLALLAGLWTVYFAIHSLLASLRVKAFTAAVWPRLMPAYRIAYNALALALLVPPLWLTFTFPGPLLWRWEGVLGWLADGLAAAAAALFLWSLRYYDGREFLGLRQLSEDAGGIEERESLKVSPLHRWVRHPWYSLGLVIVWSREMDAAMLVSALGVTAYFVVGSKLEERKLRVYHGSAYDELMARVPGLVPRPWRRLSRREARDLERRSRKVDLRSG